MHRLEAEEADRVDYWQYTDIDHRVLLVHSWHPRNASRDAVVRSMVERASENPHQPLLPLLVPRNQHEHRHIQEIFRDRGISSLLSGDRFNLVNVFVPVDVWIELGICRSVAFAPVLELHADRLAAQHMLNVERTHLGEGTNETLFNLPMYMAAYVRSYVQSEMRQRDLIAKIYISNAFMALVQYNLRLMLLRDPAVLFAFGITTSLQSFLSDTLAVPSNSIPCSRFARREFERFAIPENDPYPEHVRASVRGGASLLETRSFPRKCIAAQDLLDEIERNRNNDVREGYTEYCIQELLATFPNHYVGISHSRLNISVVFSLRTLSCMAEFTLPREGGMAHTDLLILAPVCQGLRRDVRTLQLLSGLEHALLDRLQMDVDLDDHACYLREDGSVVNTANDIVQAFARLDWNGGFLDAIVDHLHPCGFYRRLGYNYFGHTVRDLDLLGAQVHLYWLDFVQKTLGNQDSYRHVVRTRSSDPDASLEAWLASVEQFRGLALPEEYRLDVPQPDNVYLCEDVQSDVRVEYLRGPFVQVLTDGAPVDLLQKMEVWLNRPLLLRQSDGNIWVVEMADYFASVQYFLKNDLPASMIEATEYQPLMRGVQSLLDRDLNLPNPSIFFPSLTVLRDADPDLLPLCFMEHFSKLNETSPDRLLHFNMQTVFHIERRLYDSMNRWLRERYLEVYLTRVNQMQEAMEDREDNVVLPIEGGFVVKSGTLIAQLLHGNETTDYIFLTDANHRDAPRLIQGLMQAARSETRDVMLLDDSRRSSDVVRRYLEDAINTYDALDMMQNATQEFRFHDLGFQYFSVTAHDMQPYTGYMLRLLLGLSYPEMHRECSFTLRPRSGTPSDADEDDL